MTFSALDYILSQVVEVIIPDYLNRAEPFRVPISDFIFTERVVKVGEKQLKHRIKEIVEPDFRGACLAREISRAQGFNSRSGVTSGHVSYGESRVFEDGRRETLVGCWSCGAMCALEGTAHKGHGPGTGEDPNMLLTVAEAPQPNPWWEMGNFGDCKAGEIVVHDLAAAMTVPHPLSVEDRQIVAAIYGPMD